MPNNFEPASVPRESLRTVLVPLTAIIVGMFMVVLDNSALNVIVPHFITDFQASYSTVQWTITGYALAQAAVIPLSGWMADRFGAKNVFLTSIAMFSLGSLLCAFAPSIKLLVIFRIVQGLGGGMVAPLGFAFTFRLSPPEKVGTVMSFMSIPILLAPALGPVLSGWLVDYVSWHWIFLINVPIGIVGVLIGLRNLPKLDAQTVAPLDRAGMILAPLGFASLSYGITEASSSWMSWETIGGLVAGIGALVLFVFTQLGNANPLMEIRAFKSVRFTRGIIVLWIAQFAFFGTIFLIPQYLQNVRGYSAFHAGLCMLPYAITTAILNQVSGRLFDKYGARWLAVIGIGCLATASSLFSQIQPHARLGDVIIPIVLLGASLGLCMMPLTSHVLKVAPQQMIGRVTSLTSAIQQVMVSLSVSGLTTVLTSKMHGAAGSQPASHASEWPHAYSHTFLVVAAIAVAGFVFSLFIGRQTSVGERAEGFGLMME